MRYWIYSIRWCGTLGARTTRSKSTIFTTILSTYKKKFRVSFCNKILPKSDLTDFIYFFCLHLYFCTVRTTVFQTPKREIFFMAKKTYARSANLYLVFLVFSALTVNLRSYGTNVTPNNKTQLKNRVSISRAVYL